MTVCSVHVNGPIMQENKRHAPVVTRVVELLVHISIGAAVPDLELRAIGVRAVRDVEALGLAEELDLAALERPLLRVGAGARLDGDGRAVRVGRGGEALAVVVPRLEEHGREVRRRLGGGDEEEGEQEECGLEHFFCKE